MRPTHGTIKAYGAVPASVHQRSITMSTYSQTQPASVAVSTIVPPRVLSWGAILAGCVAALSTHLLLTLLGMGIGIQSIQPLSENDAAAEFSITAGISWSISALISLWIGGWVAARFSDPADPRIGRLHGFVVWSLATVVTFFFLSVGTGAIVSSTARVAGKTLSAAGQAVGAAAPAAGDAFQTFTQQNGGMISSFLDEVTPARNDPAAAARARREIGWALYRTFTQEGGARSPENRAALAQAIAQSTGRPQADAERIVNDWVASYDRAQQDLQNARAAAEQKAREVAEKAADATTKAAIWTFIAFLIGAAAATWGGHVGARRWWNANYPDASRDPFPQGTR
jgi:hypothetical protein